MRRTTSRTTNETLTPRTNVYTPYDPLTALCIVQCTRTRNTRVSASRTPPPSHGPLQEKVCAYRRRELTRACETRERVRVRTAGARASSARVCASKQRACVREQAARVRARASSARVCACAGEHSWHVLPMHATVRMQSACAPVRVRTRARVCASVFARARAHLR
eukprot:4682532-Pleurochrysis_carterae.AAC.1